MLLAGTASAPITGGLDLPFGSRSPQPPGLTDIQDELWARALVLDDTYRQLAIVGVDLLAIDNDLLRMAGERTWETVRIPPSRLMVVPTGIQTAPLAATLVGSPPRPELYARHASEQIASAVAYAARARRPAGLAWAHGATALGTASGPLVMRVDLVDGPTVGLMVELPWLPDATGRVLTGEYPGAVVRTLGRLAPQAGTVPLLGAAAGNVAGDEPETAGQRLASLAWATALTTEPDADVRLKVALSAVDLPFALPDPDAAALRLEQAEAQLETAENPVSRRAAEGEFERARMALAAAEAEAAIERSVPLIGLGLGDGAVIGAPLLFAPPVAQRVREASAYGARTLLASGVQGLLGVLTTPDHRLPALEAAQAALPYGDDAADRLVAAAAELTRRLAGGPDVEASGGGVG